MGSETPAYFTNLLNNGSDNIDSVPLHPDDPYMTSGYLSSEAPDMSYETPAMTSRIASTTKKAQRSGNYSIEEDLLLVSAWLNVSLDAVKGNEQKSGQYWRRIWEYFHEHKTFRSDRKASSLQHHWGCPALKTLALCGYLLNHGSSTGLEPRGKWKHLESLVLGGSSNFENFFSDICFQCKNLRLLHVEYADIGKDEAMAIVDFLPKLKELILRQALINRDALVTLLRGCKELVLLEVSDCVGFDEGDEEISKLASHIENFSSKGSTIIDNDYYYYEDSGSCND